MTGPSPLALKHEMTECEVAGFASGSRSGFGGGGEQDQPAPPMPSLKSGLQSTPGLTHAGVAGVNTGRLSPTTMKLKAPSLRPGSSLTFWRTTSIAAADAPPASVQSSWIPAATTSQSKRTVHAASGAGSVGVEVGVFVAVSAGTVSVAVGTEVFVAVGVDVLVAVSAGTVLVAVGVCVAVLPGTVLVAVGVFVDVDGTTVFVAVFVGVFVDVAAGTVFVAVAVFVAVDVAVSVEVAAGTVLVAVGVFVAVFVDVGGTTVFVAVLVGVFVDVEGTTVFVAVFVGVFVDVAAATVFVGVAVAACAVGVGGLPIVIDAFTHLFAPGLHAWYSTPRRVSDVDRAEHEVARARARDVEVDSRQDDRPHRPRTVSPVPPPLKQEMNEFVTFASRIVVRNGIWRATAPTCIRQA